MTVRTGRTGKEETMMRSRKKTADRERRDVLRKMLEDRRTEIHDKLRSIRDAQPTDAAEVRDAEEQSVDDFVRDVDFALMEMKSETLRRIDEALKRLEHGLYGVCEDCSGDIAEARLAAVPFATLCVRCQERVENQSAVERETRLREEREELAQAVL